MPSALYLIIGIVAILVLFLNHSDVLVKSILRFAGFCLCLWITLRLQGSASKVLLQYGLQNHPALVELITFFGLLSICSAIFRWIMGRVQYPLSGSKVVCLDILRIGLIISMIVAFLMMILSMIVGQSILLSNLWIILIAVTSSCLDVCAPNLLSNVVSISKPS